MAGHSLSSALPADVTALMPPASQGVEQRSERHAGRTGSRWGLRALVIGGLAGAAWLLTGAAAHAADHTSADPARGGLSIPAPGPLVPGSFVPGPGNGAVERTVQHVGQATHAVTAAHRPARTDAATDVTPPAGVTPRLTSIVVKPANQQVTTVDTAVRNTDDTAVGGVVRELTAPLRLTGGPVTLDPVTRIVTPTTAPLVQTLRPVTGPPHHAAVPAPVASRPATSAGPVGSVTVARPHRISPTGSMSPTGAPAVVQLPAVDSTGSIAVGSDVRTDIAGTWRRILVVDRHTAATTARPDGARRAPGNPEPAPLRVQFGALCGTSTSGSGTPSEGGSAATLPAAVMAGTVACHRLPIATDVEVRRYDAESPTASPD
jgi:hypothetical protein